MMGRESLKTPCYGSHQHWDLWLQPDAIKSEGYSLLRKRLSPDLGNEELVKAALPILRTG